MPAGLLRHKRTAAAMGGSLDISQPRARRAREAGRAASAQGAAGTAGEHRGRAASPEAPGGPAGVPRPRGLASAPTRPRYLIGGSGGSKAGGLRGAAPQAGPGPERQERAARQGQRRPAERGRSQAGAHRRSGRCTGHRAPAPRTESAPRSPERASRRQPGSQGRPGNTRAATKHRASRATGGFSLGQGSHGSCRCPPLLPPPPDVFPACLCLRAQPSQHWPGTRDSAPAVSQVCVSIRPQLELGLTREDAGRTELRSPPVFPLQTRHCCRTVLFLSCSHQLLPK